MIPLTSQAKLALAITSAGSQRNLAKLLGVTHQKVGRWLREGEHATLHDLATEFGVSAERIRQIENKAMQKMRSMMDAAA